MVDTVWKIGDVVYGVHVEVSDGKYIIGVTEETIVRFEENYWVSHGQFLGHQVMSDTFSAFYTREKAVNSAELTALKAEAIALESPGAWKEVVRVWEK